MPIIRTLYNFFPAWINEAFLPPPNPGENLSRHTGQSFIVRQPILSMDPKEHFLIISAGDNIHTTYSAVLEELRTVTHTIIFAEKDVYTNSARDDAAKRMWKCSIRN